MAAAFEVHNNLGGGLLEEIYQEAMELELATKGTPFRSQQELAVFYKGREMRKRYVPDLVVEGHLIVELKAVAMLSKEHVAQLLNYMRIAKMPVGYLLNFGPIRKLEWRRLVLQEFA